MHVGQTDLIKIERLLIIIASDKVFTNLKFLDFSGSGQRKGLNTSPDGGCFLRRQMFATVESEAIDIQ